MSYNLFSNIVTKDVLRTIQSNTLNAISNALACSFGPDGQNTAYRNQKDITRYTKDGHTILKNLKFVGAIEFTMRDDLEGITRRIVTTVGDGTTSAIILSALLFDGLCKASRTMGINEKQLVADLDKAINDACDLIQSNGKEATIDDIFKIAMISTDGNKNIASLIKSIYEENGNDVFIDVSTAPGVETIVKTYDGFTIDSGLTDIAFINTNKHTSVIDNANLYLFEDPIDTNEMASYFAKIVRDNVLTPIKEKKFENVKPTVVVCPKIGNDILSDVDALVNMMKAIPVEQRKFYPINIVTNIPNRNFIYDLSLISGATLIRKYNDANTERDDETISGAQTLEKVHEFAGHCDQVVADSRKTKFINPALMYDENGEYSNIYKNHLTDMEEQLAGLKEDNGNHGEIGVMKRRINAFKANMVEIRVGGVSETDRDSLRDLVEDAVLNCRSAAIDGYGFGANFEALRAFNYLLTQSEKGLSQEEIWSITNDQTYNIYKIMLDAYMSLLTILYRSAADGDPSKAYAIAANGIVEGVPYNIRTKKYDGLVLSSIQSDQIILKAINKILSVVFLTNQFLVEGAEYNKYME